MKQAPLSFLFRYVIVWSMFTVVAIFCTSCREPANIQVVDRPQTSDTHLSFLLAVGSSVLIDGTIQANHRGCLAGSTCYVMVERDGLWFKVVYGLGSSPDCAFTGIRNAASLRSNDQVRINAYVEGPKALSVCSDDAYFIRKIASRS